MGVQMRGRSVGTTTVELEHGPSGKTIRTTAPKDNGGDGSSFSPTDLFAVSLGTCATTIMSMFAAKNAIPLDGISFALEKEMQAAPRRVGVIRVRYALATTCDADSFERLVRAGKSCPVRLSLENGGVVVEETYERAPPGLG